MRQKSCHYCNNLITQQNQAHCRKIKGLGWFRDDFKHGLFYRMEIAETGNKLAALFKESAEACQFFDDQI